MLLFKNKQLAFNPKRCTQCGVCLAACPNGALETDFDEETGLTALRVNADCVRCGKCVTVCPAHKIPRKIPGDEIFPLGMKAFLSRNKNDAIAFASSSGGAARTIIKRCLESGFVEHAYLVLKDDKYPWARGRLITKGLEAMNASTSMYLPVMGGRYLDEAPGGDAILLAGLPCQVLGGQKLLRDRYNKIYTLSIFCKQQKTLGATRYYCKRVGCGFSPDGPPMQFRGTGWPGVVRKGEFALLHTKFCVLPFAFPLWRVPGCNMCDMPFGLDTDISIADPWGIDDEKDTYNTPGNSLVMLLSGDGDKMFACAAEELESSPIKDLNIVQNSTALPGILRKHALAPAYAGEKTRPLIRLAMLVEVFQSRMLETFLKYFKLNERLYWAAGKQPQLSKFIYGIAKSFGKRTDRHE